LGHRIGDDPGRCVEDGLGADLGVGQGLVVDADGADAEDVGVADREVVVDQPAKA
jgi:hypothetical protein